MSTNKPYPSERELRQRAREEIRNGRLPESANASIWGGPGSGLPCAVCGECIGADQVEYEIASLHGSDSFRFHPLCHTVWQLECTRQDPSPSTTATTN